MSEQEYKAQRSSEIFKLAAYIFKQLFWLALDAGFVYLLYLAFLKYEPASEDIFAFILLDILPLLLACFFLLQIYEQIQKTRASLSSFRKTVDNTLTGDALKHWKCYKRRRRIFNSLLILLLSSILPAVFIAQNVNLRSEYDAAVAAFDAGEYKQARALFKKLEKPDYRDTENYIALAESCDDYARGRINWAHNKKSDLTFRYMTEIQADAFSEYCKEVDKAYAEWLIEQEIIAEENYQQRVREGVPFITMKESDISRTTLGKCSRYVEERASGSDELNHIYQFFDGNYMIFSATCRNSIVVSVKDYRKYPVNMGSVSHKNNKSSKKPDDDPYNVNDYFTEEDFYYDWQDDFIDFEEAYDYYEEHHD